MIQLETGEIECIEYGAPGQTQLSYVRIRYTDTAGGVQFQIKTLTHGVEGSGIYTHERSETLTQAMNLAIYYNCPTREKIRKTLKKLRSDRGLPDPELVFFAVTNSSTQTSRTRMIGLDPLRHPNELVINLGSLSTRDKGSDQAVTLTINKPLPQNDDKIRFVSDLSVGGFKGGQLNVVMGKLNK